MKRIVKKHPLAIRWFHWINFPVLAIMIWSGLLIYWANDVYKLGWGDKTLIKFFPQSFYDALHIPFRLATGMAFHFFFMWFFFLNGLLYVLYTLFSGEWRYLLPNRHSFREAWQVVLHDLHIRKAAPPQNKYNAAQRIAYSSIVVMGIGSIITGLAIYKPVQLFWLCALCGGYEAARIEHFILTIGYVLFFIVHVTQVILAGWNNFQAMVTGFEVEKVPEPSPQPEITEGCKRKRMTTAPNIKKAPKKRTIDQEIKRRTVISFSFFFLCIAIGGVLFFCLYNQPQTDDNLQPTLRKGLRANEKLLSLFFSKKRETKSFEKSDAVTKVRVNGDVGMDGTLDSTWRLKVARKPGDTLVLTLNDIKALPKTDVVFDFKCVEGWSQVTWWGGVRFSDFMKKYNLLPQMGMKYVGMITPDGAYYVGNDMPSMLQPQTILCYEMNGKPLPQDQGYPLRLIIPVKYGIKHLKRIGVMYFSNEKPKDYWAEQGYDYFAGL